MSLYLPVRRLFVVCLRCLVTLFGECTCTILVKEVFSLRNTTVSFSSHVTTGFTFKLIRRCVIEAGLGTFPTWQSSSPANSGRLPDTSNKVTDFSKDLGLFEKPMYRPYFFTCLHTVTKPIQIKQKEWRNLLHCKDCRVP